MPVMTSPSQNIISIEPIPVNASTATTASSSHALLTNTIRGHIHTLFAHAWNALAVFAILFILRYATARILSWWRRRKQPPRQHANLKDCIDPRIGPVFHQPASLAPGHPEVHYRFAPLGAPPFWMMDEKSRGVGNSSFSAIPDVAAPQEAATGTVARGFVSFSDTKPGEALSLGDEKMGLGNNSSLDVALHKRFITRRPPPPPLARPELSSAAFTFDARRRFHATSGPGVDDSFIHQPNPDYMSSSRTMSSPASTVKPRLRSYAKTLPIGIPAPQKSNLCSMSVGSTSNPASNTYSDSSPKSFPPASPQLSPPPPGHGQKHSRERSPEIELQGEVISMTDGHGTGWKRHTRVYGGGICLACAASDGEGGFYGDTVSEEEKR